MLLDVGGWGFSECSGRPIFVFLLKKIGFVPWPDIVLSEILINYWQEIFLLTLTSDSEAIHCIVCGINWTTKCVVSLNVTWRGFVFVLISFGHMYVVVFLPKFCLRFQVVQIKLAGCKLSPNCKFLGKNPRVHLNIIKEWPKITPLF